MYRFLTVVVIFMFASIFFSGCTLLEKEGKSGLQVLITNDVSASAYLNDNYLEKTPFIKQDLKPGEYTLKIQPDEPSLVPHELTITLRPGLLTVVTWKLATRAELSGGVVYEMEPIASENAAELSFSSIPDGAIITINETEKHFTPVILDAITSPEAISYEAYLPSYEPQNHTISPIQGYRTLIHVKLAKLEPSSQTPAPSPIPQVQVQETQTQVVIEEGNVLGETTEATKEASIAATAQTASKVRILPTGFFHSGIEVLRMRETPSSLGKELGFVHVGKEYEYLKKTENNWHYIKAGVTSGWVNEQYAKLQY